MSNKPVSKLIAELADGPAYADLEKYVSVLEAALKPFAEAGKTMGEGFRTELQYEETDGNMYTLYRDDELNPLHTDHLVIAARALHLRE